MFLVGGDTKKRHTESARRTEHEAAVEGADAIFVLQLGGQGGTQKGKGDQRVENCTKERIRKKKEEAQQQQEAEEAGAHH